MARQKIIVIGGGIIGASIALHLIRKNAEVTLIAPKLGGIATQNSFAWINANWGNPYPYFQLRMSAMARWRELSGEVPGLMPNWCGSICYDLTPEKLVAFAAEHSSWGYRLHELDSSAVRSLEPNLVNVPQKALLIEEEGMIEPVSATLFMAEYAIAKGVTWIPGDLDALIVSNNRCRGVSVAGQTIEADEVIVAAGVGSRQILAHQGISLPLEASPGLLMYTRPTEKRIDHIIVAPHLEIRQTDDMRLVAATSFAGTEPGDDPDQTARNLLDSVKAELMHSHDLELETFTIGYRPMPKDGFPIVSRIDGFEGLYVAVTHSGITLAPAIGHMVAEEVITGERDPLLAPYHHRRFTI